MSMRPHRKPVVEDIIHELANLVNQMNKVISHCKDMIWLEMGWGWPVATLTLTGHNTAQMGGGRHTGITAYQLVTAALLQASWIMLHNLTAAKAKEARTSLDK